MKRDRGMRSNHITDVAQIHNKGCLNILSESRPHSLLLVQLLTETQHCERLPGDSDKENGLLAGKNLEADPKIVIETGGGIGSLTGINYYINYDIKIHLTDT